MMLLACALIAATTLIAKALGQGIGADGGSPLHPLQVSAGRFLFAWLALMPIVAILRPSLKSAKLPYHIGRSVAGWAGVTCLFAASASRI
jgi:drug/metabolite transporter (DMT)-like permease